MTLHQHKRDSSQNKRKITYSNVTSVGQRSSPWPCNSVKGEIEFHLDYSCGLKPITRKFYRIKRAEREKS